MRTRFSPAAAAGLTAGVLFFAHAMVPYSRAWPLLWPLLGGVAAVVLAARGQGSPGGWRCVRTGATAAAIAGGVFLVATLAALFVLSRPGLEPIAGAFGAVQPIAFNPALFVALAFAALVGIAAGALGGAAGGVLGRRRAV
jgi:hypothetical protein